MTTAAPIRVTPKQFAVVRWIQNYVNEHVYPPTVREMQRHFAFKSPTGATTHLEALRRKNVITWRNGHSRTLRVLVDLDTLEVGK